MANMPAHSLANKCCFGLMSFLLTRLMHTRAGLMQAILLTQECKLMLEKNDLPDKIMLKIRGLGQLEEDLWFSKRMEALPG